ncbi:MAG: CopD family protein [Acidobacteria bacterium]|nr:CopD family protein [Acidobacteriota bacterium]
MQFLYVSLVWLHIVAAAVWIGGMVFFILVLIPLTRTPELKEQAAMLIHWTGGRFRNIGWTCLGLLLVTGIANLLIRFGTETLLNPRFWQNPVAHITLTKLLLFVFIAILSAYHDFSVGPRATAWARTNPNSTQAARLRRQASWIGRLNFLLALIAVSMGVLLVRGLPF